jgi:hypothetical protein
MREDASESLAIGVMGVGMGAGVEVYVRVRLATRVMEGEVGEVGVVCLRRRAWSLRRAAVERVLLRTIDWSLRANCSLASSCG